MKTHAYPTYYQKFKCVANLCPDSCCKDWDVVVDHDAEAYYNTVKSPLGEKIRRLTVIDSDGDRIFVSQNGKCPFWNGDMLCDIYIGLGEERLCRTCKSFPRISQDYTAFCEHMLSFACPEAARLMLAEDNAYGEFDSGYKLSGADYDADLMGFLLKAREKTARLLSDGKASFAQRLKYCLAFNAKVQTVLNGDEPTPLAEIPNNHDCGFIFDLHLRLEIMDLNWKAKLEKIAESCNELQISQSHDAEFERLALYYIYRYYLTAIDSGDVLGTVKRIVCAYIIIGKQAAFCEKAGEKTGIVRLMQRYSKEIEHSYENAEEMDFEFAVNPKFGAEELTALL